MSKALFIALLVALGLAAVVTGTAGVLRQPMTPQMALGNRQVLAVSFAHNDHRATSCTRCHHEFLDQSGAGQCFDCHRTHPRTAARLEAHFHGLCRGCHQATRSTTAPGGPLRRCSACHAHDDAP